MEHVSRCAASLGSRLRWRSWSGELRSGVGNKSGVLCSLVALTCQLFGRVGTGGTGSALKLQKRLRETYGQTTVNYCGCFAGIQMGFCSVSR